MNMKRTSPVSIWEAEKRVFGATHADIGGYLLDLWGLPDSIVGAITYHYYPSGRPESFRLSSGDEEAIGFDALTAVHVANFFCEDEESKEQDIKPEIDSVYLDRLGLALHVPQWYDVCFATK
jgi:HD-like signal output (HDOD) protein